MKKLYHFLFYCSYCLVSKSDGTVMERASFLVSTSVSLILISCYLLSVVFFGLSFFGGYNANFVYPLIILLFVANGFLSSRYFVRTGRYLDIINSYNKTSRTVRTVYGLMAGFLFFGSWALIIFSGIVASRSLGYL
jgi:hypothetical protein